MTDIATLGIKVDASTAGDAANTLDKLTASGAKAEKQTDSLTQAARLLKGEAASLSTTMVADNDVMGVATESHNKLATAQGLNRMQMLELVHVVRAFGDSVVAGQNPLKALLMESGRIGQIAAQQQGGLKGLGSALIEMAGLVKRSGDELATADAMAAAASRDSIALAVKQADAAIMAADTELALARAQVKLADTATAATAAQERLAAAEAGVSAASAEAAIAQGALAEANVAAAETATAAAAAETVALAPLAIILAAVAVAIGVVASAFEIGASQIREHSGNIANSMGLTEKQMKRLEDQGVSTSVTLGDTFKAFFQVLGERIESSTSIWATLKKYWQETIDFIAKYGEIGIASVIGAFTGAYQAIKATWKLLPGAMGDIVIMAANATISGIEWMVNKAISILSKAGLSVGTLGNVSFGRIADPFAGQAANAGKVAGEAYGKGFQEGYGATTRFFSDVGKRAIKNRKDAIDDADGDPGKEKKTPKSEAEKAYDSAVKKAEQYIRTLKEETAEIGLNKIQIKEQKAARAEAEIVAAGARVGTADAIAKSKALAAAIEAETKAWKEKTIAQATSDLKRNLQDEASQLQFENSLIGKNAKEIEVMNAQRAIELKLLEIKRTLGPEAYAAAAAGIEQERAALIALAEARGQRKLDVENAKEYTEAMKELNDTLRDSVSGFGDLFGTAGAGFENLINVIADYGDKVAEIQQRIAEANANGKQEEAARATEELGRAQVKHYGDMLGAAKTFFKEGSTGYRILEAAEKAYRAYQLIGFALEIAHKTRAMAVDAAHTASSVANSGTRASADGIAAVAKAIASLPFPLNLLAGAATLAALVAIGVKMSGGGGGGSSSISAASSDTSTNDGSNVLSSSMTSPYSTLPGAGGLYNPANANTPGNGTLASANDNAYAANNSASGGGGSTFIYSPQINAPNADAGSVQKIQDLLKQNQQETVNMARVAAAQDRAAAASRQRIGGA